MGVLLTKLLHKPSQETRLRVTWRKRILINVNSRLPGVFMAVVINAVLVTSHLSPLNGVGIVHMPVHIRDEAILEKLAKDASLRLCVHYICIVHIHMFDSSISDILQPLLELPGGQFSLVRLVDPQQDDGRQVEGWVFCGPIGPRETVYKIGDVAFSSGHTTIVCTDVPPT